MTLPNVFENDQRSTSQTSNNFDRQTFEVIPLSFFGGTLITQLSVGQTHAGAINMNGELWTWGNNNQGQCGVHIAGQEIISVPVRPFYDNQIE